MAKLLTKKVVNILPTPLTADTIYFVKAGIGFDLYVTNSSGTIVAYPLNVNVPDLQIITINPTSPSNGQQWILETDTTGEIQYNQLGLILTNPEKKYELCVSINGTIKKSLLI